MTVSSREKKHSLGWEGVHFIDPKAEKYAITN